MRAVLCLAALAACLATFALAYAQLQGTETGVRRDAFTLPGGRGEVPVPVLRYTPQGASRDVVAVVAHGLFANKELMSDYGVELARAGITTYTFDFPGHGESTVPFIERPGLEGEQASYDDAYFVLYEVAE